MLFGVDVCEEFFDLFCIFEVFFGLGVFLDLYRCFFCYVIGLVLFLVVLFLVWWVGVFGMFSFWWGGVGNGWLFGLLCFFFYNWFLRLSSWIWGGYFKLIFWVCFVCGVCVYYGPGGLV